MARGENFGGRKMEDDKSVKKGEFHEKRFTDFLNNHGIPFLFIGQDSKGEHYSATLKEGNIKRPDYIIYLHTIGHVFIDVKSRYKIEDIENTAESYFYLKDGEIDSLFSLQSYLMLPLWITFVSTKKGDDYSFYLIPISVLKSYKDRLKSKLGTDCNLLDFLLIRIPNSFLKKMSDINDLITVNNSYNFTIIEKEAEKYRKLNEKIMEIIKDIKENGFKKDTKDYCRDKGINYVKAMEIDKYKKLNVT
jgi:hypothetical protein